MKAISALALCLAACAPSSEAGAPARADLFAEAQALGVPNARAPFPGVLTAGQVDAAQLDGLAKAGVRTLVNLRVPTEDGTGFEAARAEELGVAYVALPIAGSADVTEENARRLAATLDGAEKPVLVYCGSSNRVGALFALKAHYVDGKSADEALEIGKSAGLTRLEPDVRAVLGL
jgi:uncharacterized protein (TIGR01244 family)